MPFVPASQHPPSVRLELKVGDDQGLQARHSLEAVPEVITRMPRQFINCLVKVEAPQHVPRTYIQESHPFTKYSGPLLDRKRRTCSLHRELVLCSARKERAEVIRAHGRMFFVVFRAALVSWGCQHRSGKAKMQLRHSRAARAGISLRNTRADILLVKLLLSVSHSHQREKPPSLYLLLLLCTHSTR